MGPDEPLDDAIMHLQDITLSVHEKKRCNSHQCFMANYVFILRTLPSEGEIKYSIGSEVHFKLPDDSPNVVRDQGECNETSQTTYFSSGHSQSDPSCSIPKLWPIS